MCYAHVGDLKTQQTRLLNLKEKFKGFKIVDDESVESYIHRVNGTAETIWAIGGMLEESDVIIKILFTLTKPYKLKKCAIEECHDLNNYTIDQLIKILSAYDIGPM